MGVALSHWLMCDWLCSDHRVLSWQSLLPGFPRYSHLGPRPCMHKMACTTNLIMKDLMQSKMLVLRRIQGKVGHQRAFWSTHVSTAVSSMLKHTVWDTLKYYILEHGQFPKWERPRKLPYHVFARFAYTYPVTSNLPQGSGFYSIGPW